MKSNILRILCITLLLLNLNCKDNTEQTTDNLEISELETQPTEIVNDSSNLSINPISHATMVLETEDDVIYVDPVGGAEAFEGQKNPTLVLITDIHGDHLSIKTLEALDLSNSELIVPQAVADKLPESMLISAHVMNNDDELNVKSIGIKAIPMYNLREEAKNFHTKGRGNGYVLTIAEERIYISGDTEDIPEMRNLKAIDKAFVCMNLPYTMTVQNAASAVIEFKPKEIYPYHYRGSDGFSDVDAFKTLVNKGAPNVKVVQLNWYK